MIQVAWEPDPEHPERLRLRRARALFLPEADEEGLEPVSPESALRRRVRLAGRKLP